MSYGSLEYFAPTELDDGRRGGCYKHCAPAERVVVEKVVAINIALPRSGMMEEGTVAINIALLRS